VVTPDLAQNFPNFLYFTYFGYHIGAMIAAAFLVYGLGLYPRRGAVARVLVATLAWAAIAGAADVITRGNYMYLAWKPTHNSLLSVMGPWPWYIVSGIGVALAMLMVVHWVTNVVRRLLEPGDSRRGSSTESLSAGTTDAADRGSVPAPDQERRPARPVDGPLHP
jgi:uncharacterized membrane protein YwaF